MKDELIEATDLIDSVISKLDYKEGESSSVMLELMAARTIIEDMVIENFGNPAGPSLAEHSIQALNEYISQLPITTDQKEAREALEHLSMCHKSMRTAYRRVSESIALINHWDHALSEEDATRILFDVYDHLLVSASHLAQERINADTSDDGSDIDRIQLQAQCAQESSVMLDDAIHKLGAAHAAFVKARRHLRGNHLDPITYKPVSAD